MTVKYIFDSGVTKNLYEKKGTFFKPLITLFQKSTLGVSHKILNGFFSGSVKNRGCF